MKKYTLKYTFATLIVVFFVACSTKKNNFVSRNSHALSTKYNILYNGGIALDKGIQDLKSQYKDNFWETLPVERMQVTEQLQSGKTKNANFERAEEKSTKAIQKHSMNIDGGEKNPQMDEAHLMLGKSRYYDQRFVPALEAFNYVLYKYPNSDKIYEVKIWREKTNMRMDNDAQAITNLRKLLKEIKFKDQIFADANATLAQAFLNLKQRDSAVAKLKLAREFTTLNEEKARYRFILGQVYDEMGYKDSSFIQYDEIIDMNRKSSRNYVIQSHVKQALQFDYKNGDTIAFLKKFNELLKDRENRPFLDALNHQMGLFYDKNKKQDIAIKFYNKSLKSNSQDQYLIASNHRNLAEIYFDKAKYVKAGKYYDSTLVSLKPRTREFNLITKKRLNLEDVIKFEGIAQTNDSILKVASLSSSEKEKYYQDYIDKIKKEDDIKKKLEEKEAKLKEQLEANNGGDFKSDSKFSSNDVSKEIAKVAATTPKSFSGNSGAANTFYFYNPATVAYGKIEFKKKWGSRALVENWRLFKENAKENPEDKDNNDVADNNSDPKEIDKRYTTDFYIKNIPTDTIILDSLSKQRNFAYYQLGVIYKEKFKEYQRAADKLEKLLEKNPEERLILPSMYNLFKIYEIIDKEKALAMKSRIMAQYPDSRYAQIITNSNAGNEIATSPEIAYDLLYKEYEKGLFREVLTKTETAIEQFTGEEMLPKFELLKANLLGKLKGLTEFKKALNYVALTYPNSEEGKETEIFIATKIPYLEALTFNSDLPISWKILFAADNLEDKKFKILQEKLTKFCKERTIEKLTTSVDIYTLEKNFIVVHGINSKENAIGIAQILKEFKEYKIPEQSYVISNENYKVVQIKKNLDEYLSGDFLNKEIIPVVKNITLPETNTIVKKVITKQEVKNAMNASRVEANPSANPAQNTQQQQTQNPQQGNKSENSRGQIDSNDPPAGSMMPPTPTTPRKQ